MTREEAKAVLYEWQESMVKHGVPLDTSKVQALRVAIEALSEPNDDLINKDAVSRKGLLKSWEKLSPRGRAEFDQVIMTISAIPLAEPNTGKWIKATGMMPPEFHGHHCCSECSNFASMESPFGNREDLSDFCPNCGAMMLKEDSETE